MKKLLIIHRDLLNLRTGGALYLANTISYFKKKNVHMEVLDFEAFPARVKRNRFFLILHILKYYINQRNGVFSFTNHNLCYYLLIPYYIKRIKGNRYGCGCHLTQYKLRKNPIIRMIEFLCEYLFLHGASLLIVPSKAAIQQFSVFHLSRKKMIVIKPAPNIFNKMGITSSNKIGRLLFAGQVIWRKGLDVLIKALVELRDLQLHLDITGSYDKNSTYFKEIEKSIHENELNNAVLFHGHLSPEKLAELYRNADIFVFPSRHETYGMVLAEAMSFGLPIVASSIPTTVEIIKNEINGLLYDTENHRSCATAIRKLVENRCLRQIIAHNNIKLREKTRNWEIVGEENLKAIQRFLIE